MKSYRTVQVRGARIRLTFNAVRKTIGLATYKNMQAKTLDAPSGTAECNRESRKKASLGNGGGKGKTESSRRKITERAEDKTRPASDKRGKERNKRNGSEGGEKRPGKDARQSMSCKEPRVLRAISERIMAKVRKEVNEDDILPWIKANTRTSTAIEISGKKQASK